ncbi:MULTISPECIES: hypothetical protein [Bacillaceae]|uniref:Uncharacterized protein n=1 Tax=Domibacillus aminovorans TaxID=29332 RepID=A0A177L1K7_9BACI|nr:MULTISPECIES: hypothetical protein [Bacillaceae]OAH59272.1 hypothetical protein AWH48_16160 [Domibacillus aminovorans]
MEFKYCLTGSGWATCFIEVNSQKFEFTASYLSDCLDDFLKALMYLNIHCVPKYELKKQTECEWDGEPEGIVWSFELKEKWMLSLKVMYYEDLDDKENQELLIKTEYPYDDFLRKVVIEVDSLIKRNGLVVYREKWNEFDFPLSAFLKLKHAVIYRNKYPSAGVMGERDEEMRSYLKNEMELLLQEIH